MKKTECLSYKNEKLEAYSHEQSWYANKLKVKIEVFDMEKLLIGFDSKLWEPNLNFIFKIIGRVY